MHFVFVIINFLLLAGILYFAGRKTVQGIFRSRYDKIDRELTEAAAPLELPPLPHFDAPDTSEFDAQLRAIRDAGDVSLRELEETYNSSSSEQRREMLMRTRKAVISQVLEQTRENVSRTAEKGAAPLSRDAADHILEKIHVTPGDMAYIKRKGVLYVTLISAIALEEDLVERIRSACTDMVEKVGGKISFRVKEDSSILRGMQLRIGDTIYDYSLSNKLYRLRKELEARPLTENDAESMLEGMRYTVENMELGIDVFQVGRVISVGDGICWLDGLADIMYGELVEFEGGMQGMVLDIQPDRVGCVIFGRYEHVDSYSRVRRLNKMASVPVGEELLGRVVDALGEPIDGRGRIWGHETRPIEHNAPAIPDRQGVSVPLHTGIISIDALVPIGRGQRELIIGDRQTGKTAIVIDTILSQKGQDVLCIYVAIGHKRSSVADMAAKLESLGAMEYTTIVSATASDSASLQYIAPFAGAAMSEYFMYKGRDVLIIYDDLSKHAVAYRELSLLLHRPSGREAYPGDIFYLHSRLLERAARLSEEAGGGSVTALPIIETQAGDISAYIPTNVISITDGQIFLDNDLYNEGQRPAINVGLSVSRVGGAAQRKWMKQVSAHLRTGLAQYRELAAFTQFGADLDAATKKTLEAGSRMMYALRQPRYSPLADWQEALMIYVVSEGFADSVEPAGVPAFLAALLRRFEKEEPELVETLSTGARPDAETLEKLNAVLGEMTKPEEA